MWGGWLLGADYFFEFFTDGDYGYLYSKRYWYVLRWGCAITVKMRVGGVRMAADKYRKLLVGYALVNCMVTAVKKRIWSFIIVRFCLLMGGGCIFGHVCVWPCTYLAICKNYNLIVPRRNVIHLDLLWSFFIFKCGYKALWCKNIVWGVLLLVGDVREVPAKRLMDLLSHEDG